MTRRAPSFARAFTGRWRITEMDEWDEIDLAGSAHITFSGKDRGELAFLAVEADLDVRYGSRDGAACAEFSWEGFDDGTAASGRGWAALGGAGRLVGHIFIHKRAGLPHHPGLRKGAWPPRTFQVGCSLGGEQVAIGQHIEPARMLEITGERANLEARSGRRFASADHGWPASAHLIVGMKLSSGWNIFGAGP